MKQRVEEAERLFKEGYNCSQSVFAAFSDLYGIDQEVALRLSSSFGGGIARMREVCGAVSGMCMVAGLETGSSHSKDREGKKFNYDVVQSLNEEFKEVAGSIICRELLGLDKVSVKETTPQIRDERYYKTRPCAQLVRDAAEILERALFTVNLVQVTEMEQLQEIAALAENIWHEHYDPIIGREQVDYMLEHFQSVPAMEEQLSTGGYQYYMLENMERMAGYFAIRKEDRSLFLSKLYINKKYRGRAFARKVLEFMEGYCRDNDLTKIWLTVNRNNENSISVYEQLGFIKAGTKIAEIGSGFVMDDYLMEKQLTDKIDSPLSM